MAQTYAAKYLLKAAASAPRDIVNSYVATVQADSPDGADLPLHVRLRRALRDVQQLAARRPQDGHDARADRPGLLVAVLEERSRSRTCRAASRPPATTWSRSARSSLDRLPEAPQVRHQHDRPDAAPRDPDAHEGGRALPRARRHLQRARLDRRRRRDAQRRPAGEARLRQGAARRSRRCASCRSASRSTSASRRRSSTRTSTTPRTSWRGRAPRSSTSCSTWSASPSRCSATPTWPTSASRSARDEERMRKFFLERVRMDPLLDGQNYIYMHYADMIAQRVPPPRAVPVPDAGHHAEPGRRAVLLREQRRDRQRARPRIPKSCTSAQASQEHRDWIRDEKCPTCLSPCQMNVAAVKQVVPYVKFLVRASREKRRGAGPHPDLSSAPAR